jgi:hypothetical protein
MTSEVLLGCTIHMVPFQKIPLSNLVINGIVDFSKQIEECSAQEILAALMLHHPNPKLMQRVLTDLSTHQSWWNGFAMGPALPSTKNGADPGSLVYLRDLWIGWGANTLYLLAPFSEQARSLQNLAKTWECTEVKVFPPKLTRYLLGMPTMRHHLLVLRWERTVFMVEEVDFATTYGTASQLFEGSLRLSECLPQTLIAGLLRCELKEGIASRIVDDLYARADLWHSFLPGPQLPSDATELTDCLRVLSTLPTHYSFDCIYIWSRGLEEAETLKRLSQTWNPKATTIFSSPETSRLLALPKGPPVVTISL